MAECGYNLFMTIHLSLTHSPVLMNQLYAPFWNKQSLHTMTMTVAETRRLFVCADAFTHIHLQFNADSKIFITITFKDWKSRNNLYDFTKLID